MGRIKCHSLTEEVIAVKYRMIIWRISSHSCLESKSYCFESVLKAFKQSLRTYMYNT